MISLAIWQGTNMSVPQSLLIAVIGIIVVLAELALIAVFIKILSAVIGKFSKKEASPKKNEDVVTVNAPKGTPLPETQSEGTLDLIGVDEATAACIMAIVSNESGIPLNRLAFKSIKLLEDN